MLVAHVCRGKLSGAEQVFQNRDFISMMKVESVLMEHKGLIAAMREFATSGQVPELLSFKPVAVQAQKGECQGVML